jgi:hypothetical protein
VKITKVSYGRTIEVGGPFGRRPVEKVWFGWELELEERHYNFGGNDTVEEAIAKLHEMADEQEKVERTEFYKRARDREHENEATRRLIRKPLLFVLRHKDLFLQKDQTWGPRETADLHTAAGVAHWTMKLDLTDYTLEPA